jgi:ABC-type uncharacterized transport system ATPase subunit
LLKDGKRRLYGEVDEIRRQFGSDEIVLGFQGSVAEKSKLYTIQPVNSHQVKLLPANGVSSQTILKDLTGQPKLIIESFQVQQPTLDDIFVQIYQGDDHA